MHTLKLKFLAKYLTIFIVISCGENSLNEPIQPSSIIQSIEIENNVFSLTTKTESNFKIEYRNGNDVFYGFSAKNDLSSEHQFTLFGEPNTTYSVNLHIENSDSFQDTMFSFMCTENSQSFLQVHVVDIEQGDGNLIITPDGEYIAVDGGFGTYEPAWGEPGGEDDGSWDGDGQPLMRDYVSSLGITNFQYLIETHDDMDHCGGIHDIMNSDEFNYEMHLSPSHTNGFANGDYLIGDETSDFSIRIINIGLPNGVNDVDNNYSIVLRIVFGDAEFLLTGDAEASLEEYILYEGFDISSDFLKIGHHGSNTSSSENFVSAVLNQITKIGTVSFGTDNPYGHPHSLGRFRNLELFGTNQSSSNTTDDNYHFDCGTIRAITDGNIIIISTEN